MARVLEEVGFVHLHVHSSYSLLEGALKIDDLKKQALGDRMPALALTDTNNLFGALEFSEKLSGSGIQPIIGVELSIDFGDEPQTRGSVAGVAFPSIVLIAATEAGYDHLMALSSEAYLKPLSGEAAHIAIASLAAHSDGVIALTGGPKGPLDRALASGQSDLAEQRLQKLKTLFGDRLYMELQRHGLPEEERVEPALIDLAYRFDVPLVATNEPFFPKPQSYEAHDALMAIAEGRLISDTERRRVSPDHYFKTRSAMKKLFADLPEALAKTIEIALRCSYRPQMRKPILPRFTDGQNSEAQELRKQATAGLKERLTMHGPAEGLTEADYHARLDFELSVIERMDYPGYFLIVADFIQWAKAQGIPVGPGRGSGAGSLVAYALTITDLDPLRFGLLFERFLNPERVSMPDFDIDFCQDRRDEVIRYVRDKYGADRVA